MKLGEIYQIYFDSRAKNMISPINDMCTLTYTVNWNAILPEKYKQFQCKISFKSESLENIQFYNVTESAFISMDFGKMNVYDGYNTNSNKVGFVFPRTYYPNTICYTNDVFNDGNIFTIERPINNTVQVKIRVAYDSNTVIDEMPHYLLVLNLQGIIDTPN